MLREVHARVETTKRTNGNLKRLYYRARGKRLLNTEAGLDDSRFLRELVWKGRHGLLRGAPLLQALLCTRRIVDVQCLTGSISKREECTSGSHETDVRGA